MDVVQCAGQGGGEMVAWDPGLGGQGCGIGRRYCLGMLVAARLRCWW